MDKGTIKIAIADDHTLFRKLVVDLLRQNDSFEVVGDVSDGRELINLLKESHVDVVLVDIRMPVMDGNEAISIIKARFENIRIIILSFYKDHTYIVEMVSRGINGYLTKNCLPEELEKAILNVYQTGYYFEEDILKNYFVSAGKRAHNMTQELTVRELEIARELCDGQTEKEVAFKLKISPHTVHFHRNKIYSKIQAHNIAGLLKYMGRFSIQ